MIIFWWVIPSRICKDFFESQNQKKIPWNPNSKYSISRNKNFEYGKYSKENPWYEFFDFLSFLVHCKILKTYFISMYIHEFFYYFRFIVLRRLCLLLGLLYGYRAITMFVTVLPISNPNYQCDPKLTVSGQAKKKTRET